MGYRLQMSAEIYDWLAELRGSDPPAAALAAQALAALADDGDRLGPPLVVDVAGRLRPDELLSALDRHYQAYLESTTASRRRVAEAATLRKDIERQLAGPGSPPALAGLRERLAAAIEAEQRLIVASQREQMRADAFRTRKEVLKAAYTAAEAVHLIEQAQPLPQELGIAGHRDQPGLADDRALGIAALRAGRSGQGHHLPAQAPPVGSVAK